MQTIYSARCFGRNFLCSISRQYLLGWEKMEMPSEISVAEGENLQCLQIFLQALRKNLQALQIFVDADIGFCEFFVSSEKSVFCELEFY